MAIELAVLGETGKIGRHALAACRQISGVEVTGVSRRGEYPLDLSGPGAPGGLDRFDTVVNTTDGSTVSPLPLARRVLENGGVFIETSADPQVVGELLELRELEAPQGSVILCGGLFPGLSQLLARAVAEDGPAPARLEVAVRYRPWSGAGRSTCRLMADALGRPAARLEGGEAVLDPPVAPGPRILFPSGAAPTVRVGLAEAILLGEGRPGITTGTALATRPSAPAGMAGPLVRITPWRVFEIGALRALAFGGISLLRRGLLRGVETPVELVAIADRGTAHERSRALRTSRGMAAVGVAAAATAAVLTRRAPPSGVHTIDAVSGLDETLEACARIGEGTDIDPVVAG